MKKNTVKQFPAHENCRSFMDSRSDGNSMIYLCENERPAYEDGYELVDWKEFEIFFLKP